jgi:hypothetical protein
MSMSQKLYQRDPSHPAIKRNSNSTLTKKNQESMFLIQDIYLTRIGSHSHEPHQQEFYKLEEIINFVVMKKNNVCPSSRTIDNSGHSFLPYLVNATNTP